MPRGRANSRKRAFLIRFLRSAPIVSAGVTCSICARVRTRHLSVLVGIFAVACAETPEHSDDLEQSNDDLRGGKSDTTAPTIAITSPATGALLPVGNVELTGTAADNRGVKLVEVTIDGGTYQPATPKAPGDWSAWTAIVDVPAGSHKITSRATDA